MPKPASLSHMTPAERMEHRLQQIRDSAAQHRQRLKEMTPAERAAWKARASLGEGFDPYTPEERQAVESLSRRIERLKADAERLNAETRARLKAESLADPSLEPVFAALVSGNAIRVDLEPF